MIAKLTGRIDTIEETSVIIDVAGVGYQALCSRKTLGDLAVDATATLWIEPVFRTDTLTLFGFGTKAEKMAFMALSTVQGVGGKVALSILSTLTPDDILQALSFEDATPFTRADGVGPKLAQRIARELKGKEAAFAHSFTPYPSGGAVTSGAGDNTLTQDAISALLALGYKRPEIMQALRSASSKGDYTNIDTLLPATLKILGANL